MVSRSRNTAKTLERCVIDPSISLHKYLYGYQSANVDIAFIERPKTREKINDLEQFVLTVNHNVTVQRLQSR